MEIREYTNPQGYSPFAKWFNGLDAFAAAKVTTALYRLGSGYTSNIKNLGAGVFEYKVDFGPGYRIYFGCKDKTCILLLGGGTKKRQSRDIQAAKNAWQAC